MYSVDKNQWEQTYYNFQPPFVLSKSVSISCSVLSDSLQPCGLQSASLLCPWNSLGKKPGVSCHSLFSRESSQPRDRTQVSCIAGGFFYHLSLQESPHFVLMTLKWLEKCWKTFKKMYLVFQDILLSYCCRTSFKRRKLVEFQQDQKQYNDK